MLGDEGVLRGHPEVVNRLPQDQRQAWHLRLSGEVELEAVPVQRRTSRPRCSAAWVLSARLKRLLLVLKAVVAGQCRRRSRNHRGEGCRPGERRRTVALGSANADAIRSSVRHRVRR